MQIICYMDEPTLQVDIAPKLPLDLRRPQPREPIEHQIWRESPACDVPPVPVRHQSFGPAILVVVQRIITITRATSRSETDTIRNDDGVTAALPCRQSQITDSTGWYCCKELQTLTW